MTKVEQVEQIVELGVDAVGMILHADSPRQIDVQRAQQIREVVPAFVTLVGVVVDCPATRIDQMAQQIGLDLVQLHGSESAEFAESLSVPYIKAIRARSAQQVATQAASFPGARAILVDPYVKGIAGGTGVCLDASFWPENCPNKLVLAGGLSADNITNMVEQFQPFAVDLNSGVEFAPGDKDLSQINEVFRQIRN